MEARLIFIEGLSGSGKSTIGQHLALHLQGLGHQARWIYEHETPHPIGTLAELRAPGGIDRAMDRWRGLVARMVSDRDEVLVFDGMLFQLTSTALQFGGASPDEIERSVREIEAIVAPVEAAMIYLRPEDVEASIRRIRASRGDWYEQYVLHQLGDPEGGLEAVIRFFEAPRAVTDRIFSILSIPRLAIDSFAREWEAYRREIGAFLSIPPLSVPYRPVAGGAAYAGRYRHEASGDEMGIVSEGEHLFLEDRTRLIPGAAGTFLIEGMNAELWFPPESGSGSGGPARFELRGRLPGVGTTWTKM